MLWKQYHTLHTLFPDVHADGYIIILFFLHKKFISYSFFQ